MTVLKGPLAVKQSKALIRTFKRMKDYILEKTPVNFLYLLLLLWQRWNVNRLLIKQRMNIKCEHSAQWKKISCWKAFLLINLLYFNMKRNIIIENFCYLYFCAEGNFYSCYDSITANIKN